MKCIKKRTINTLKLPLSLFAISFFLLNANPAQAQSNFAAFEFSSSSSATHDTLFSFIDLEITEDSLENYNLVFKLNAIENGDTLSMDQIELELEDYGSSDLEKVEFNTTIGQMAIRFGSYPMANYLLSATLVNNLGVLIEKTTILSE